MDLLLGAHFITLLFIWRVGDDLYKKSQIKKISFKLHLFFSYYYFSIDLKRQSEHTGLRPDTSSLVSASIGKLCQILDKKFKNLYASFERICLRKIPITRIDYLWLILSNSAV